MNGNEVPLIRAIRGPITLITIGVLFALNNFTAFGFDKTWPVLLIVFGLLSLIRRGTERVPPPPVPPVAQYGYPPSGGYAQSPYAGAPAGPAKGGFGSSAPPRTSDPGQSVPPGGSE